MNLLRFSLIISFTGIFFLFLLSMLLQPKQITTRQIQNLPENTLVKITGAVIQQKSYNQNTFCIITLKDNYGTCAITLTSGESLNFSLTNKTIKIIGKIQQYNGEKQIQAEKILL